MSSARSQGAPPLAGSDVLQRETVRIHPALGSLAADWDKLARDAGTPFMTSAWLSAWGGGFGRGVPSWILLQDANGSLRAGAFMFRRRGRLDAAANLHSGDWNGLACDEQARAELWAAVARIGVSRIHLQALPADARGTRSACEALEQAGYRLVCVPGPRCPWLELPDSWEDLLGSLSSRLRAEVRRSKRKLEGEGSLVFRTVTGGPTLDSSLDRFLRLEASSWKGRSGTAILSQRSTERLYREFAHAAAEEGWLRLNFLELDGTLIASSYDSVFSRTGYLMKMAFSASHGRFSPGLVLLSEILQAGIREGIRGYDFLGEADAYKARWTPEVRPRMQVFAYRGPARPGYFYRNSLRPVLKAGRDRVVSPR